LILGRQANPTFLCVVVMVSLSRDQQAATLDPHTTVAGQTVCDVICEGFPAWLWALRAVVIFRVAGVWADLVEYSNWLPPDYTSQAKDVKDLSGRSNRLTFVSGTREFLVQLFQRTEFTGLVFVALEGPLPASSWRPSAWASWQKVTVNHDGVGGVTTAKLTLYHTAGDALEWKACDYTTTRLEHLLDIEEPDERRKQHVRTPEQANKEFRRVRPMKGRSDAFHINGLAPIGRLAHSEFACKTNERGYLYDRWCLRVLSGAEIARAYDAPELLQRLATAYHTDRRPRIDTLPFLGSTPLRLLRACAIAVHDSIVELVQQEAPLQTPLPTREVLPTTTTMAEEESLCDVICEHFPDWAWALQDGPFRVNRLWITRVEYEHRLPAEMACRAKDVSSLLDSMPSDKLTFVSGSPEFVHTVFGQQTFKAPLVVAVQDPARSWTPELSTDCLCKRRRCWTQKTAGHERVGGVTTASLQLWHTEGDALAWNPSEYNERRLMHVMEASVCEGKHRQNVSPPNHASASLHGVSWYDKNTLHVNGMIPIRKLSSSQFVCRYGDNLWQMRKLGAPEIARAYDLSDAVQKQLGITPLSRVKDLPFTGSTPLLLLKSCARAVYDSGIRGAGALDPEFGETECHRNLFS
jgi:hypothetical protein